MYPDLYLMRHGQTVWNAEGRMQGKLDSPLNDLGIAQAQAQARLIAGLLGSGKSQLWKIASAEACCLPLLHPGAARRSWSLYFCTAPPGLKLPFG